MAEEYAYTNWEDENYHEGAAEGLPFDPIGHTEKTFKAGANAVIDEIWDYISELPCKSQEEANNQKMLLSRIQKLKNG